MLLFSFFPNQDNHLFYYRTDKETDADSKTVNLLLGSRVEEHNEIEVPTAQKLKVYKVSVCTFLCVCVCMPHVRMLIIVKHCFLHSHLH